MQSTGSKWEVAVHDNKLQYAENFQGWTPVHLYLLLSLGFVVYYDETKESPAAGQPHTCPARCAECLTGVDPVFMDTCSCIHNCELIQKKHMIMHVKCKEGRAKTEDSVYRTLVQPRSLSVFSHFSSLLYLCFASSRSAVFRSLSQDVSFAWSHWHFADEHKRCILLYEQIICLHKKASIKTPFHTKKPLNGILRETVVFVRLLLLKVNPCPLV